MFHGQFSIVGKYFKNACVDWDCHCLIGQIILNEFAISGKSKKELRLQYHS